MIGSRAREAIPDRNQEPIRSSLLHAQLWRSGVEVGLEVDWKRDVQIVGNGPD